MTILKLSQMRKVTATDGTVLSHSVEAVSVERYSDNSGFCFRLYWQLMWKKKPFTCSLSSPPQGFTMPGVHLRMMIDYSCLRVGSRSCSCALWSSTYVLYPTWKEKLWKWNLFSLWNVGFVILYTELIHLLFLKQTLEHLDPANMRILLID